MGCPVLTFGTSTVAPRDRIDGWTTALAQVCGQLHADAYGAATVDVDMEFGVLGRLHVGKISASRHRVGLTSALARTAHHPVIKMIVQTVGTSVYEQGCETVTLGPGEGLVYDVARPHMITSEGHTEHLVAIIPRELAVRQGICLSQLSRQRFSTRSGVGRVAASLLDSTLDELAMISPDSAGDLAASIVNLALSPLASTTADGTSALRYRAKTYIREHLRDPQLSVEAISAGLGCSTRYLHRAFSDEPRTISETILAMRIEGCVEELQRRPDRTISEIAYAWGFSSSAHFSRVFRKTVGKTPSQVRAAAPAIT